MKTLDQLLKTFKAARQCCLRPAAVNMTVAMLAQQRGSALLYCLCAGV